MGGLDGNGESIKAERSPRGSPENSDYFGNKRKGRPCSTFAGFEPSPASTASLNKPKGPLCRGLMDRAPLWMTMLQRSNSRFFRWLHRTWRVYVTVVHACCRRERERHHEGVVPGEPVSSGMKTKVSVRRESETQRKANGVGESSGIPPTVFLVHIP